MGNLYSAQEQETPGSTAVTLLLCTLLAIIILFTSPYRASNLPICTDSVEYAIGAENIVETGRFFIRIQNEELPSRYPPWFSLIALAPSYLVFGCEPVGNAIISITFFSIMGIIAAFLIGHRISGKWGGFSSASILLLLPAYRAYSHHVMTEIPCSALALLLSLLYLDMRAAPTIPLRRFAVAGIIAGVASAFRPACAAFVLPFILLSIFTKKTSLSLVMPILLLAIPQFIIAVATMAYNAATFGSIKETGYNFWCSDIFSNPHLVFSVSFLKINLPELLISGLPALLFTICCLWIGLSHSKEGFPQEKRETAKSLIYYLLMGTGPIVILHLFYFWYDQRFFLPSLAVLAALTGGLFGRLMGGMPGKLLLAIQITLMAAALAFRAVHTPTEPARCKTTERIKNTTPPNALVISSIDPVYLEYFLCRDSQRRILPLSRSVDYTSTNVARQSQNITLTNINIYANSQKNHGGLYPYVAEERLDLLAGEIKKNIPVFMDTSQINRSDMEAIGKISEYFNLTQRDQYLYELTLKHE